MTNKLTALAVVAVFCIVCAAPIVSEESDGTTSVRVSEDYLLYAPFIVEPGEGFGYSSELIIMRDGSSNDQLMDRYLTNPDDMSIRITSDDRDDLYNLTGPTTFNVYKIYPNNNSDIWFNGYYQEGTVVLDPYNTDQISFFVKAGDTFDIDVQVTSNTGEVKTPRIEMLSSMMTFELDALPITMNVSTTLHLDLGYDDDLYYDVSYNATGYSAPNGSPAVYFIVCAAITILVLAILVYAGIKPKWSK